MSAAHAAVPAPGVAVPPVSRPLPSVAEASTYLPPGFSQASSLHAQSFPVQHSTPVSLGHLHQSGTPFLSASRVQPSSALLVSQAGPSHWAQGLQSSLSQASGLMTPQVGVTFSSAGLPGFSVASSSSGPIPGTSGVGQQSSSSSDPPPRSSTVRDSDSEDSDDSSISECRHDMRKSKDYKRIFEYVTALYPQALGVAKAIPTKRAVDEDLFSDPPASNSDLPAFNWFERVSTALSEADDKLTKFHELNKRECSLLPGQRKVYGVAGNLSKGKELRLNKSLQAHIHKSISRNRLVGINLFEAGKLETTFRGQAETLSHSMWMLSGLLGFIRRDGYQPSDQALFNQLLSSVTIGLADIAASSAAGVNFTTYKRRQFYTSHLPAYFPEPQRDSLLVAPANLASSLFREEDIKDLLDVSNACTSLKSHQAMVEVARSHNKSRTPPRSPRPASSFSNSSSGSSGQSYKRPSRSPSRSPKRVRFSSLPVSSSKSPPAKRQNFHK